MEEETQGVTVEKADLNNGADETMEELGLIEKLMSHKDPNITVLTKVMGQAWNTKKAFEMHWVEEKIYTVQFKCFGDTKRVLYGGTSHFDHQPFMIRTIDRDKKKPAELEFQQLEIWVRVKKIARSIRTTTMAEKIGNLMGIFLIFDEYRSGVWRTSMRLRVKIDVSKPLQRGVLLENKGEKTWHRMTYEKLPVFCYNCGLLGNPQRVCPNSKERMKKDWMTSMGSGYMSRSESHN
ncbi:unnamed protein product [Linum trigynum]|uniref:Zinc knuckle CX2CX4HX4C domain-containing protein n=1 Tax=Linum trigynum TaxID=586398 RepID=A0AAV2F8I0_9ROSI